MEMGRVGYVSKDRTIKGKKFVTDNADKVIMVGFAHNHSRDTYCLYRPCTQGIIQTRNVKWATWKPTQPGDEIQVESLRSNGNDADSENDAEDNHQHYFGDDSSSEGSTSDDNDGDSFFDIDLPDDEAGRKNAIYLDDDDSDDNELPELIEP